MDYIQRRRSKMGRSPCYSKEGLNRGAWTKMEDTILSEFIRIHGEGEWRKVPQKAGLKRCGKSCRLRWINYLHPDIIRGNISPSEEELIFRLYRLLGNRWSLIAGRLPGRTDNEIKNYWNTHLKKKLLMDKSQPNTMSKSPPSIQNHVFKPAPVRIASSVKYTEMAVTANSCSNRICSDHEALKFSDIEQNANSSKSGSNFVVNDAVTEDVNLFETDEARNSTCSISSLADQLQSPHSDNLAGDGATLADRLFDLNKPWPPDSNLLRSPSV